MRDLESGTTRWIGFDQVMIATRAAPVVPDWAIGVERVHPVKTLDDGATWIRLLAENPRTALVVGNKHRYCRRLNPTLLLADGAFDKTANQTK